MILSDKDLIRFGEDIIRPFSEELISSVENTDSVCLSNHPFKKVPSFGLSSYGYDLTAKASWKLDMVSDVPLDPLYASEGHFEHIESDKLVLPPNSFALTASEQYVKVPRDCLGIVLSKSTYARAGIVTLCTPLEPEWEGEITLEFANLSRRPVLLRSHYGIVQVVFMKASNPCAISYKDRAGKYQSQTGITLSK